MMIEPNNPEINVDELMQKIRNEVAKRQVRSQSVDLKTNIDTSRIRSNLSYIEALLKNAESRAFIRTKWPDKLNRFPFNFSPKLKKLLLKAISFLFNDQREVNFNLINSLKESVALNRQIIEQITTVKTQVDERLDVADTRFQSLDERLDVADTRFRNLDERLDVADTRFQNLDERLDIADTRFQNLDERLDVADTRFQNLDERLDTLDSSVREIDDSFNTIDALISNFLNSIQERLDTMNSGVQEIDEHLSAVEARMEGLNERLITTDTRIQTINELYTRNDSYLKNDLIQLKRLITMFLEEARKSLPEPFSKDHLATFVNENQHFLDAFYVAFEDQFRGSREDIFNSLKVYLPLIKEAKIGTSESPIVDVGCGRGEWLELLRESGYIARGIDINRVMLEQCRSRGLEVIEADVIAHLRALPDSSLGAVTGFHIIEHLPFETLVQLFDEAVRVLKPGGLVVFETPNTRNILVGSGDFYRDPTHKNPIHPDTISFLAESRGLINSKSYFFEQTDGIMHLVNSLQIKFNDLNEYVKVSRDMVLIAYKA
ncbi:MAG: methyltransferase domain-containing protein [Nostoc sp.]|uniref:class I SAM-dependent methyltransferase n=1 Tax=Nostoc sp. TaxID=1180 RepID=UPI002FFAD79F